MILDKLKAYGFLALSIALGVLLSIQTVRLMSTELELAHARTEFAQVQKEAALNLAAATAKARRAEAELQAFSTETRKKTNAQVQALSTQRDALLARLRLAEARAASPHVSGSGAAAGSGGTGSGSAGGELLGTLGEADVREAERADTLRFHLAACYAQYHRAQEALKAAK